MSGWISVKENLPPIFNLCLIYCKGMKVAEDCMAVFNGYEWMWWVDGIADFVEGEVTHWMLLPDPPQTQAEKGVEL